MSVTPAVEKASKVAPSLALRLVEVDAIEGRALLRDPAAADELQWALDPFTVSWQQVGKQLVVTMPFAIEVAAGAVRHYEMRVALRVTYDIVDGTLLLSPKDVDHYAGIHAVLHAWPYLRAEVQSLSTKLGMVAPVVLVTMTAAQLPETVEVKRVAEGRRRTRKGS